jgi:hypothetical protein
MKTLSQKHFPVLTFLCGLLAMSMCLWASAADTDIPPQLAIKKEAVPGGGFNLVFSFTNSVISEGDILGTGAGEVLPGTWAMHSLHFTLTNAGRRFQRPAGTGPSTPVWTPASDSTFGLNSDENQFNFTAANDIAPGGSGTFMLLYNVDPGADFTAATSLLQFDPASDPTRYINFLSVTYSLTDLDGTTRPTDPFGLPTLARDDTVMVPEPAGLGLLAALLLVAAAAARRLGHQKVIRTGVRPLHVAEGGAPATPRSGDGNF